MQEECVVEILKVCGFCNRKLKKRLAEPSRKLIGHYDCETCPTYYAKYVVKVNKMENKCNTKSS